MATVTMQAPSAVYTKITCRSGNSYSTDANGLVQNVAAADVLDLMSGGWTQVAPGFAAFPIALHHGRNTDGSTLAAAAASGKFGQTITLGTSSKLVSEVANASTITDSAIWDVVIPNTFPVGYNPTITVNCNHILGSGTLGAHTIAVHAYPVNNDGSQDADIVTTAAQNTPAAAADVAFSTAALSELLAGGRVIVEATMQIVSTGAQAISGNINSIRLS